MRRTWIIAALALGSCGDEVHGLAFEDLDAAQLEARCAYLVRCGLFTDADGCAAHARPRPDPELAAAVADGTIVYHAVEAQRCVDQQAAQGCNATMRDVRVLDACDDVFVGTVDDGEACAFDGECRSGDCDVPTCQRNTCCTGSCKPTLAISSFDGPCEDTAHCVADAYCGTDHLCHGLAATAESCQDDEQCDYGLACIGATDLAPGACRAMPLQGESCPYQQCAEVGMRCDSTGTCMQAGLAGAACQSASECSPFAHCDPSGHCADAPLLGAPCTSVCGGDAWCDFAVGTCVAPRATNAECAADTECESFYCEEGPVFDLCSPPAVCL